MVAASAAPLVALRAMVAAPAPAAARAMPAAAMAASP
jgi:hypothetical protein